jgi:HK97 family phage portal protein
MIDFFRLLTGRPRFEERAISKMDVWGRGDDWAEPVWSGSMVSRESAIGLTAVWAAVRKVSGSIASFPVDVVRRREKVRIPVEPGPQWLRQPNPETTWFEFIERVVTCVELDGNAYLLITARDSQGFPAEIWTLHPNECDVRRERKGAPPVVIWGGSTRLSMFGPSNLQGDVLHIKNFSMGGLKGLSTIQTFRQTIGLGLAEEEFGARFFGQGQALSGVIQMPEGPADEQNAHIDLMREVWKKKHQGLKKSHLPGFLTGGATWKPISVPPEDAQFLESRRFQVAEIARIFDVPLHMLQETEKATSWGSGIEQMSIGFVQYSLTPRLVRLEQALSQLAPRGQYLRFETKGLLRGDIKAQAEAMAKGRQWGTLTPNKWNELNDEPPIEDPYGDSYLVPAGYGIVSPGAALKLVEETPEPFANGNGSKPKQTVPTA